jgi:hypothetical protein
MASGLWLRDDPGVSVNEAIAGALVVIFALMSALTTKE